MDFKRKLRKNRLIFFFMGLLTAVLLMLAGVVVGGSLYMLDYALAPNPERQDTAQRFRWLFEGYPETRPWVDSLRRAAALCDTFAVMPSGERHHAFVIRQPRPTRRTAVVLHGWRDQAIGMLHIARLYEQMGYDVVVPDLHAHGLSEGDMIGMGWQERRDVLRWMELFRQDTMVIHGISMGAATTMNVAGEAMPEGVRDVRFVEDCGYTSVWDEFSYEMGEEFGLSDFPLMFTSSLLCWLKLGWRFGQASPLRQVAKCQWPMLFIHGDNDHFVPSWMVHPLYEAKPGARQLWITQGTQHALSYKDYPEDYAQHLRDFLSRN